MRATSGTVRRAPAAAPPARRAAGAPHRSRRPGERRGRVARGLGLVHVVLGADRFHDRLCADEHDVRVVRSRAEKRGCSVARSRIVVLLQTDHRACKLELRLVPARKPLERLLRAAESEEAQRCERLDRRCHESRLLDLRRESECGAAIALDEIRVRPDELKRRVLLLPVLPLDELERVGDAVEVEQRLRQLCDGLGRGRRRLLVRPPKQLERVGITTSLSEQRRRQEADLLVRR